VAAAAGAAVGSVIPDWQLADFFRTGVDNELVRST
jgi:hypothetical protein